MPIGPKNVTFTADIVMQTGDRSAWVDVVDEKNARAAVNGLRMA